MLVQYKGKNLYNFIDKFRLVPGINEVDDSEFNKALSHPIFKMRVADGQIVVLSNKKGNDGKMSVSEMRRFIPNIFDKKLLEKILSEDDRPEIQKMAHDQLDRVKHPASGTKKAASSLDTVEHFGGSVKGE